MMMSHVATRDPFDESLWGEYARILLIGTAACTAITWVVRIAVDPTGLVMVIANALIIWIALSRGFAGLLRLSALSVVVIGIVATFAAKQDPTAWWSPLGLFSPLMTVAALLLLVFRDGLIAIRKRTQTLSPRKVFLLGFVLAAAIYMIVIPGIDAFLEIFRERPGSYTVEELSPLEILRVRSAKLTVFAIFAYAGACVGSFVNVVAASAPLGQRIALRSSACPQCGTRIRRIDNLPIISYLRLRGRCRDCGTAIPVRYFVVELTGLAIFASLFLYELITGAANVPGFQHYTYAGILWIILYTKWPVIGIYFFHCGLLSCLLTLALMEQDRLHPPRWMKIALPAIFAGIVVAVPTMLTVSFGDQTPLHWPSNFPAWLNRAATSTAGGFVGWAVGFLANSTAPGRRSTSPLAFAFALLGIALGWQAVLTIATFWLAATVLLQLSDGRFRRPLWLTATTLLFVIAMLHQPAWKWLTGQLGF